MFLEVVCNVVSNLFCLKYTVSCDFVCVVFVKDFTAVSLWDAVSYSEQTMLDLWCLERKPRSVMKYGTFNSYSTLNTWFQST